MANITRESLLKRLFSDPKHYPYGFSRSGDFSINESKALAQYGCLFAALVDGVISPTTEEDKGFMSAAYGESEPNNVAEKAWVKYQKRINRPKLGSIGGTKPIDVPDDDEVLVDDENDLELMSED